MQGGTLSEALRVDSSGFVGIGTSSPLTMLHVVGDLTVEGNIAAKYQDVAEWVEAVGAPTPGTVVVAETASLLRSARFLEPLTGGEALPPTLPYGEPAARPGLHVMAAPTAHAVETLSGMGGTGVQIMLAHVSGAPIQGHPMIPLLQISADGETAARYGGDLDRVLDARAEDSEAEAKELLKLLVDTLAKGYVPRLWSAGNTDFQITRGFLGLSL